MISVLIIDDSRTTRIILRTILETDSEIEIVGEAENGQVGYELTKKLKPDLITMDIHMPIWNGLEATRKIMSTIPTPILVVTGAEEEGDSTASFQILQCGALEVVDKPVRAKGENYQNLKNNLIQKVKTLAKSKVFHYIESPIQSKRSLQVIAIGASTGGPRVLLKILRQLPNNYPYGIVLVQHIASNFIRSFHRWLNSELTLNVKLAEEGDRPRGGTLLLAPSNHHLTFLNGRVHLEYSSPVCGCIPSVDVLFKSVAREFQDKAVGILLTGMGRDGAKGLMNIREGGGHTIAQEENSCVVYGMPKVAIEMEAAIQILSPLQIAHELSLALP